MAGVMSLELALIRAGHLFVEASEEAKQKLNPAAVSRLREGLNCGTAQGLELLAATLLNENLPPTLP